MGRIKNWLSGRIPAPRMLEIQPGSMVPRNLGTLNRAKRKAAIKWLGPKWCLAKGKPLPPVRAEEPKAIPESANVRVLKKASK